MVTVMAKCSVIVSLGKRLSVLMCVYGMEWCTSVMRPPPPDGQGRSRRMVAKLGKGGRVEVEVNLVS